MHIRTRFVLLTAVFAVAACSGWEPTGTSDRKTDERAPDQATTRSGADGNANRSAGKLRSACTLRLELLRRLRNGTQPARSADVVVLPRLPNFFGTSSGGTNHSGPWDYLQKVPLVLYGPGFIRAQGPADLGRPVTLADVAPTYAELLGIPWPRDRAGRALTGALVPAARRPEAPRLIVTVVWDGAGWNVLRRWPGAWPGLESLIPQGTSVRGVVVGSSPSVTPAVHATLGTGVFPERHGIVDIPIRYKGEVLKDAWEGRSPQRLATTTLADLYDLRVDNEAKIGMVAEKGWHLGMIGHGAALEGGDKDVAVLGDRPQQLITNRSFYSLPDYMQEVTGYARDVRVVDLSDGKLDSSWRGHEMLSDPKGLRLTPVFSLYQTRLLKTLIAREGYGRDSVPDLLYTNYKQIDLVGHAFNMVEPEVQDALTYSDAELMDLTSFLDRQVGKGEWVMAVTADHGQQPSAEVSGGWPIDLLTLEADIEDNFGTGGKLIETSRPGGFWLDREVAAAHHVSAEEVSRYLMDYRLADGVPEGTSVPVKYKKRQRHKLFRAAWPGAWMDQIWRCATRAPERSR